MSHPVPTKTVKIQRVDEWKDVGFSVFAVKTDAGTMTTTRSWQASICRGAIDDGRSALVTWEDAWRNKKYLKTVELV